MPKLANDQRALPPAALQALRQLGENLAVARIRRKESQRVWAKRIDISVPTLIRMERGDPGVAAGAYATALWLIGRAAALPDVAAPDADRGALEKDVRHALERRAVRSGASAEARLARKKPRDG